MDRHPRRIKVLYLVVNLHRGGVQQLVWDLCQQLDPARYIPVVCALEEDGDIGREMAVAGVTVVSLGLNLKPDRLRLVWELYRLMRQQGITILHAASYHPSLLGRIAGLMARVPIWVNHEHMLIGRRRLRRAILNNLLGRMTQANVAVSQVLARQAIAYYHLDPNKMQVIYNAVNSRFLQAHTFREASRRSLGLAPEVKVIGMLARLHLGKGYQYLFEAAEKLSNSFPIKILLVGFGPHEREIRALAERHNLGEIVMFLGMRRDIPELLGAMDLYVLPDQEGFLSLMEAMAAGLPVVVSSHGGNQEVVEDGKSGLVFPWGDTGSLAWCIQKILANPALAQELGQGARERVKAHFTTERYGRQMTALYDRLVRENLDPTW